MLSLFTSEKLCIDIRGTTVKYMQARYNSKKKNINIKRYGSIYFAHWHSDKGILCSNEETVKIIRNFVRKERITAKNVYINISDPSIVLRIVKVPMMSDRDLRDYLDMEIYQYLHIDFDINIYDFKVLSIVEEDGKKMMNLLLTSVSKELIFNYMQLFRKAGMNPLVIDVYPNSIARVFASQDDRDIAILDVNENSIDFVILHNGELFMYSNILMESSLSPLLAESSPSSKDWGKLDIESLLENDLIFASALNDVINNTRTYMNFFSSRHFGKSLDTVYLLGNLALVRNIDTYLNNILQVDIKPGLTQVFSIENRKGIYEYNRGINIDRRIAVYTCNLGLALRGV